MVKKIKKYKKQYKEAEKDLKKKIGMFDRLPDECLACHDHFDKTDIKEVSSWNVVVRGEAVRLYCPGCWNKAKELVEETKEKIEEEKRNES